MITLDKEDIELTEEEVQILTRLTNEARERLEFYKQAPTPKKWLAFTIVQCETQSFLAQLLALRGVKVAPYKTS